MDTLNLSLFRGMRDTQPQSVTLIDIVTMMRTDQSVRDLTDKHRYARSTGDEQGARHYKQMMTNFGVAARFEGGRQQRHIVALTGLSLVDIDHIAPEDMERVLALVREDPHTLLAYVTLSGQGVRVLYRYAFNENDDENGYPLRDAQDDKLDVKQSAERYKQAFAEGNKYYSQLTGLPTDAQCKNVGRVSAIAYAPDLYYNPDAVPFTIATEEKKPVGRPRKEPSGAVSADSCEATVLGGLERRGVRYEPGNHNRYISDACYEMNRLGVPEEDCIRWAVERFADYAATDDVPAIVRSCYRHTGEHGTRQPHRTGTKKGDSSVGDVRDIRHYFEEHGMQSRYNVITHKYELYDERTGLWCENTDRMESTLYCSITDAIGKRILKGDLHTLLESNFSPDYNPLAHYLDTLPSLGEDDTTDYIDLVASMVHVAKADEAKHRQWFKKWFVAMLATWLDPKVTNHVILTYIGPQGIYKSTFMRRLMPPALDSYFAVRNYASRMDKDDRIMLAEKGLVALEEIDSLTPRELNQLKAIVTAEAIDERDPYGKNRERRYHLASFCATGNNRRFLTDLTGNRRWLPFYVTDIDSPYTHPIPHDRLYAQAYALYRQGFQYWFDPTEVAALDNHNQNFEEPNMTQELIETYFRPPYGDEVGEFYTSANILTAITTYCSSRVTIRPRDIYVWMNRLGYKQCRAGNLRGWNVIVLTGNDIHDNHRLNAHRSQPDEE